MADIILTGDLDSTSVGTKGADIAIDDSSGDNVVNLGAGDDLLKYYVSANLDALSQYNGGSGIDTLMLMLSADQLNAINSTTMLADFNARTSSSFDFSQYDAQLGFHLDLHSVNFEHLVLNRIASATDDVAHTNEDTPITINVLANDDDSLAENKVIVAYGTKDVNGHVINNHLSESGALLILNPDGTISYDPRVVFDGLNTGQSADDKFYYELQVTDPNSAAIVSHSVATVNVTVDGVDDNHAPTATLIEVSLLEDNAKIIQLQANDPDGDALTYSIINGPIHGSLSAIDPVTHQVTYTPNPDFNGKDGFTYQVDDGNGGVATADALITVENVNDAPDAAALAVSGNEDTLINGQVSATDADGQDVLIFSLSNVDIAQHGNVVMNANGSFTYTPDLNYNGSDSFKYQVSDGNGGLDTAIVNITVNPVNDAPVANALSVSGNEDTVISGQVVATDADHDPLTFVLSDSNLARHGDVSMSADGNFTYTPNPDFNGTDSFEYKVNDGQGGTSSAIVTITVAPVNDAPEAKDLGAVLSEDVAQVITLQAVDVDNDPLTYSIISGPLHGSLSSIDPVTHEVTYTPNLNYNGTDVFTYQVDDGHGGVDTATVGIKVDPVNDAPVANALSVSGNEDTAISGQVSATDVDGDNLTFSLASTDLAQHGVVVMNANGSFTYTPNLNYVGSDVFKYQVSDGNGGIDTEVVNVTVNPGNHAPVAQDAAFIMDDTGTVGSVAGSYTMLFNLAPFISDIDGDPLHIQISPTAAGSITLNPDGTSFLFTKNPGQSGFFTLDYVVNDGQATSNTAHINLFVPLYGTNGRDLPLGTSSSETIYALDGDDVIRSNGGNDIIFGGLGNDSIILSNSNGATVIATGGQGVDSFSILSGSGFNSRLIVNDYDPSSEFLGGGGTYIDATDIGGHILLNFTNGNSIELMNVSFTSLNQVLTFNHFI